MPGDETHILIINQHGDNRGDEAAMRAMIRQLASRVPESRFTVLHQFNDPQSEVEFEVPVEYLPLRIPARELILLGIFTLLASLGVQMPLALGKRGRRIVERYRSASLVVCAPGGPYFGDIYADHEIVHWLYAWIAKVLHKPMVLYAPSVGPFKNRLLNIVRRRGFRWFRSITLREDLSASMLAVLTDGDVLPIVTADSALQETMPAVSREAWTDGDKSALLAVVAVRDPGDDRTRVHDEAILTAIEELAKRGRAHIIFLPQVHGKRRDKPYLEYLADRVPAIVRTTVLDESVGSDTHRSLIAAADVVVAGRYHPAVFSVAAATPVLVIPYEHKSWGLARAAGIERWTIDVKDVEGRRVADMIGQLLDSREDVRRLLAESAMKLQAAARKSTEQALKALERT